MGNCRALAVLLAALPALAEETAIAGRLRELQDPVVAAHGLSRLAPMVCARDHAAGVAMFADVANRIDVLDARAFLTATRPLPVPSFTTLWRAARAAAVSCDPVLAREFDRDRSEAKMEDERGRSRDMLARAKSLIADYPDRAAQLMEGALSVTGPEVLDMEFFAELLSRLRDRSPEPADDVFAEALEFVTAARDPNPAALMDLGKYVFVPRQYYEDPDKELRSETVSAANSRLAKFERIRRSASLDDVRQFAEAAVKVLGVGQGRFYDPTVAVAITRQLLRSGWLDSSETLDQIKTLYGNLAARPDSNTAAAHSALGLNAPDMAAIEPALPDVGVDAAIAAAQARRFAEARERVKRVNDAAARRIVAELVDFFEAADAIARKDLAWATVLANGLRPGAKRALLYAGIAAAAPSREAAFEIIQMGLKDIAGLPSEQQMALLAATGAGAFRLDPDTALFLFAEFVRAANEADAQPRRNRGIVTAQAGPGRGSSTIRYNRRGLAEVIDEGAARHRIPLRVPGATRFTLAAFIAEGRRADPERLRANILALRNESQFADGLIALAALLAK